MKIYKVSNKRKMKTKNEVSILRYDDLELAIKRFEKHCINDIRLISDKLSSIEYSITELYDDNLNIIKKIKISK